MFESTHDQPEALAHHRAIYFPALTIEAGLYAALAFVAFFVRFFFLDLMPLAGDEAAQALASWDFVNGISNSFTGSPLLFTGNAIIFALFGATDTAARFLPALFGSALVLLPTLFRRELGRSGALIASALLMLSPSLVFFSRNANGAIIAVTCAFAALAFVWRFLVERTTRDLNLAAVFFALALVSAREVWTIIAAMLFFAIITRIRIQPDDANRHALRFAGILFGIVFLSVATTFFMHREGLGATIDLFTAWLAGLRPSAALFDPLRLLFVYEPILLFFGAAAMIQLGFTATIDEREQTPLAAFALWLGIAFVFYSIGEDKQPARVVALVVPLAMLTGWRIARWLERAAESTDLESLLSQELPVYLLALTVAAFFYLVLVELVTRGSVVAIEILAASIGLKNGGGLIIASIMLIAIVAVSFLIIATVGRARAKDVGLAIVLTLFAVWTFRQTMLLNFPASNSLNPREYLVQRAASTNVRDLVRDLQSTSSWRANDAHVLRVAIDETLGPMVAWHLRDFRNAAYVARPAATPEIAALVLRSDAPAPASGWMRQIYRIELAPSNQAILNPLRWLIFRDVGEINSLAVALWIPQP